MPKSKKHRLLGPDGYYFSDSPGTLGGHSPEGIYGRLDRPGALRWIAKGNYVAGRVFFANESLAKQSGYRPCAVCMPVEYEMWKSEGGS